jgi:hypothetical protein
MSDGTHAVVHLTWSGKPDQHPVFPWTIVHDTLEDFAKNTMFPDAAEFGRAV